MNQYIRKNYGREICRRCINQIYRAHLKPRDCRYGIPYPQECPCCGRVHNIVTSLRLTGRLKLLGKKPVKAGSK